MKINEFAILTESRADEAPIGMFKRAATGLAGFFSSSKAQESKVQGAVNAMYKEYKNYYTPTPEGKPTGENLKAFIVATGYPLAKKYKDLTGLYTQVEKAKKMRSTKPNAVDPEAEKTNANKTPDNTIDFNKVKQNSPEQNYRDNYDKIFQKNGMYEALTIKADTVLSNKQVEDIIEFIVRDSYADDRIKELAPGAYTQKLRTLKKKQQQEKQKKTQAPTTGGGNLVQGDDGVFRFQ